MGSIILIKPLNAIFNFVLASVSANCTRMDFYASTTPPAQYAEKISKVAAFLSSHANAKKAFVTVGFLPHLD